EGFLACLRERCDAAGALLVVDTIFTGLGRLGTMWPGSEVADVLCVGKALGGGLPLSAALFVRPELEEVWKLGPEDVYTHTHTGEADRHQDPADGIHVHGRRVCRHREGEHRAHRD